MVLAKQEPVRFRRRYKRLVYGLAILLLLLAARFVYSLLTPNYRADADPPLHEGLCEIVKVLDGVTLLIRQQPLPDARSKTGRTIKVRLLSVTIPDDRSDEPGNSAGNQSAALAFTTDFLSSAEPRIELDRRIVDLDGAGLVYVFVDDISLNESLIRAGLARVDIYPGDSRRLENRLRKAEEAARVEKLGIWSD